MPCRAGHPQASRARVVARERHAFEGSSGNWRVRRRLRGRRATSTEGWATVMPPMNDPRRAETCVPECAPSPQAGAEGGDPMRGDAGAHAALLGTLLGIFPEARVLTEREEILHERPAQRDPTRSWWRQHHWYGRWNFYPGAFRFRGGRSSRGNDIDATRRRSAARRSP